MGSSSSKPTNKTGKKVVQQKLENAKKTGVLSLREHNLVDVPDLVFDISNLRTLDVSQNKLQNLSARVTALTNLKSLNVDENKLAPGSLGPISQLSKLQILSAGGNELGMIPTTSASSPSPSKSKLASAATIASKRKLHDGCTAATPYGPALPSLPGSLKQLKLDYNSFQSVPEAIYTSPLTKLEKLNLSQNNLAALPGEIARLVGLVELLLDNNAIVSLPAEMANFKKLKVLSLKNNQISVQSTNFSPQTNPQPIPAGLFSDTPVIDLNLHGNQITNTQIHEFDGFHVYLERRKGVKTKNLYGGAMIDLDVCGLE
mmetsp:Transcript_49134/g.59550  ORF Transcript_49134/g.59550 Transcript_49134/m.59550 type:complete len:316 (+) Transcript_49134:68-1015(+)|eukprot:CAMPEP_0172511114 /NCGR_PEP_ID=MMETSP1066-20121228/233896_1 /TAXON_ID=671091 /ORGANISM="Coscinodiscus wailesii, Strain CCMP2513" /LENGTH=315 /DNA_ID=CAMNT_0013290365 /DNA_START=68 /DNA_END=1015 /DNA_ORIENTATION=-